MRPTFATLTLLLCLTLAARVAAQQQDWVIEATTDEGSVTFTRATGQFIGTNGVKIIYGSSVLFADTVSGNRETGDVEADGNVHIQDPNLTWVGPRIRYNFKTKTMSASQFRAGQAPMFVGGENLEGNVTNQTYTATHGYITLDDYSDPLLRVRAKKLVIRPGDKFEAYGATMCIGNVPILYLPYYSQSLSATQPAFTLRPGYDSRFGGYLYGAYAWDWTEALNVRLNADYRTERGFGGGPDLQYDLGRWGEGMFSYYYLHDEDPETNSLGIAYPDDRQRIEFNWLASPFTNTTFKSRVSYQTDEGLRSEFFEGEYRDNVQPSTFVEARHFWDNFSLSAIASPRVNDFFETVERLPELRLSAFRQQIGHTPVYYESDSHAGYLRRLFAETNTAGLKYEAARADTWHQLVLPVTLFGWLNFTPHAGGRFTYYSEADGPGATTDEIYRSVFDTGAELSFKLSRTWAGTQGGLFALDGLRHIVEPSASYVYVADPDATPSELPQFDFDLPSLRLLPNEFPDRNAVDAVDSANVVRLGLNNRLQTKRDGQVEDWLGWDVFADWRIDPDTGVEDFSDLWSDFSISPRSWFVLRSQVRYDLDDGDVRLAFNSLTLRPNSIWNWRVGHYYLQDDFSGSPTAWGEGDDVLSSTIYVRLNENWGARASHYINLREGELQEQSYSLYRDYRSWTAALSFRVQEQYNGETEYSVSVAVNLKALPRYKLGQDSIDYDAFMNY